MSENEAPSSGARQDPSSFGFSQGTVVEWDATAGTNIVRVRGVLLENLKSMIGSETGLIRVDDRVVVGRLNNSYAVFGRLDDVGVPARAFGVEYAFVTTLNNPTASSVFQRRNGPEVSVYIGSSRRCMVTLSAEIVIANNVERMSFQVAGASTIAAQVWRSLAISSASSEFQASRVIMLDAGDGLNEGLNKFQTMHWTGNHAVNIPLVGEVQITVQPF